MFVLGFWPLDVSCWLLDAAEAMEREDKENKLEFANHCKLALLYNIMRWWIILFNNKLINMYQIHSLVRLHPDCAYEIRHNKTNALGPFFVEIRVVIIDSSLLIFLSADLGPSWEGATEISESQWKWLKSSLWSFSNTKTHCLVFVLFSVVFDN